ncbi:helix-turn-helix domain-containing protein [Ktedonobacter robiniae]|uniref:Tetratricopeptide repeat protein n=1 Tax=Ktedonobacter robiniae TaxID=2778365 RepID=A0ABQ3UN42_9CHLR|nr:helix-turn-helix domain-containing protein [Ktedonobacter robiniae]GHO53832.1 tetratricopeptide repeat protein [Ktedonobacter robiniae]
MNTGHISRSKKSSPLRKERERHSWTQSEVAERLGTNQINVSRWENGITTPSPFYRQRLSELFEKNPQELGFLPENDTETETPLDISISDTIHTQLLWRVPHRRNPLFTGRTKALASMNDYFNAQSQNSLPLALSGLGGTGKTQIAIEYAYLHQKDYQAIFWLSGSRHDALYADFVELATLLQLTQRDEQDQDAVIRAVKRWLNTHTRWFLILDNIDNLNMINEFVPMLDKGHMLITTRLQALGAFAHKFEIENMRQEESVTFLLRRIKSIQASDAFAEIGCEERRLAEEICTELGCLPLALDQAGAYIEETRCGLARYLQLYQTSRSQLLSLRGDTAMGHPDSITTTWSLSFQQIAQASREAADFLHLLAFLSPEAIPEEILTLRTNKPEPELQLAASNPLKLDAIIKLLMRYSLIRRNPEEKTLHIHRLVQAVLRDGLAQEEQRTWARRAIHAVDSAFPVVEHQNWHLCQRILPHALSCAFYIQEYHLAFPEAAHLLYKAAAYLMTRGNYEQAEPLLLNALSIQQSILGENHPDTARTLNDLGDLYFIRGSYKEADSYLQKALSVRQQVSGTNHPDVAETLNRLANLYRTQGNYNLAIPAELEAIKISKAVFGGSNLLVAKSYYNLAKIYEAQGDYQQAEKYCKLALQIQEQLLGETHPIIPSSLNRLARIQHKQGKLELAMQRNQKALELRRHTSGLEHEHIATILNSIVEILHDEGKYQEAQPMIEQAYTIQEQALGNEHPYLAYTLRNRGYNFFLQSNYTESEAAYKRAICLREQKLGVAHPYTAILYFDLAKLYICVDRFDDAEVHYHKALEIYIKTYGANHPATSRISEEYMMMLEENTKSI